MDMWLVVGMQRNSLGIPWVKEYLWIISQGVIQWDLHGQLQRDYLMLKLAFPFTFRWCLPCFEPFISILHHYQCWSFLDKKMRSVHPWLLLLYKNPVGVPTSALWALSVQVVGIMQQPSFQLACSSFNYFYLIVVDCYLKLDGVNIKDSLKSIWEVI